MLEMQYGPEVISRKGGNDHVMQLQSRHGEEIHQRTVRDGDAVLVMVLLGSPDEAEVVFLEHHDAAALAAVLDEYDGEDLSSVQHERHGSVDRYVYEHGTSTGTCGTA
jgi:hypothetical protein